jgi:hypothetical protein
MVRQALVTVDAYAVELVTVWMEHNSVTCSIISTVEANTTTVVLSPRVQTQLLRGDIGVIVTGIGVSKAVAC